MARQTTPKAATKRPAKSTSRTKAKGATKPAPARKSAPAKRGPAKKGAARKAAAKTVTDKTLLAHPGTVAMFERINACNKPPICWQRLADGSYLECHLRADCTYGNCVPVDASQVPPGADGC
jgi:hypothetical protein